MNFTTFQQACDQLFPCGFTYEEVYRLCRFRETYGKTYVDQAALDARIRHLEFIRWLVSTGKLTDECVSRDSPLRGYCHLGYGLGRKINRVNE